MTKTVAKTYWETLAASRKCKPRSERQAALQERLRQLMRRQLKIELIETRKECRS